MTRTLRSRIVVSFVSFAVFVAAVFGLATAVFLYTVEDSLFESMLREEAARLERAAALDSRSAATQWPQPSANYMTIYTSTEQFPADLRTLVETDPKRREFSGDSGRHYHVHPLFRDQSTPSAWLVAEVSDRLVVRPMRRALLAKWLFIECAMLVIALVLALRVSRRIAQPLTSLAQALKSMDIAKPQSLEVHNAEREVRVVMGALDEMRSRVHAFVDREQRFTRDASHELRTPLSVIQSTTAQAVEDPGISDTTRRLLQFAREGAEQLERTVASLLALAREDTPEGSRSSTFVLPVLERIVLEQAVLRDTSRSALVIDVSRSATLPVSDSVLHILLSNVLGNAFAHAAPGEVRVSMRDRVLRIVNPVSGDIALNVRDLSLAGVRRAESPGYGLGLSIVERLCERSGLVLSIALVADGLFEVVLQPA